MSVLGKLLKGSLVGVAVSGYGLGKSVHDALKEKIDEAKMEELLEKDEIFKKQLEHLEPEERKRVEAMSKNFALIDMAKSRSKRVNKLEMLKYKYNLTDKKVEKVESK